MKKIIGIILCAFMCFACAREKGSPKDIELLGMEPGVKEVRYSVEDDEGAVWHNCYEFDREGMLQHFQSWRNEEPLFEWLPGDTLEDGSLMDGRDLIPDLEEVNIRPEVDYYN